MNAATCPLAPGAHRDIPIEPCTAGTEHADGGHQADRIGPADKRIIDAAARIAAWAERSLRLEIETWPKPGLVSHVDTGSHNDMTADTFMRSARALHPYFSALVQAGARREEMTALRKIGLRAEQAMLAATHGVNTHRGAIFGIGLLSAAAGWRLAHDAQPHASLGAIVARAWGHAIEAGPRAADSHGEVVAHRYGAGGARREAARGFPSVYEVGVPALRAAAAQAHGDREAMRVQACFALIAVVEDTNLLHRGGPDGLAYAQCEARTFLARGGITQPDWRARAAAIHRGFVVRNLSPGGSADLLAMSVFVDGLP
ncbi:MAG: triphosphoribosyl-dephospho-CoA synthase MdcB [Achromobacter sp.]